MAGPSSSSDAVISLRSVTKVYSNGVVALDRLSMEVGRGEVFGLLGPNGAGKTTLVKVLTQLVKPTEARGSMLGRPLGDRTALRRIGYLPENAVWPEFASTQEVLDYAGRLHGLRGKTRRLRVAELLDLTGLEAWKRDRPDVFSKGMRQRLALAWSLMGNPELVFLDEPSDGVDPVGRKEMRDLILALKGEGRTVFVNSHLLGELELLCDRVAILSRGQVVRSGSLAELTGESSRYEVVVGGSVMETRGLVELVHRLGGTVALTPHGFESHIHLPTLRPHVVQPVVDEVRRHGFLIISVGPARKSLEELFLEAIRLGATSSGRLGEDAGRTRYATEAS